MTQLNLSLLGRFQANSEAGLAFHFATNKTQALLAYLVTEAKWPHSRDALAGLLWPEKPQEAALTNLRSTLASLRRAIGDHAAQPPYLIITRETVQFNRSSDYGLDVAEFLEKLSSFSNQRSGSRVRGSETQPAYPRSQLLASAVALYRGPFLDGFPNIGSAPFEEWILSKREQYHEQMLLALRSLSDYHEERGEYPLALPYARRQIELEPWQEEAHQQVMRILALSGQRSKALAQFETCQRLLSKELGVEPSPETTGLFERIKNGEFIQRIEPRNIQLLEPVSVPTQPFVARQPELSKLDLALQKADNGQGQVVFVVGESGSGKTALMAEFIRRSVESNPTLVTASGRCNAYTGLGDPYLPFLEVLSLLTGDLESRLTAGSISREQARRLYARLPEAVQSILERGPDLIDRFVSSKALLTRLQAVHSRQTDPLEQSLARKESEVGAAYIKQIDLCEQYTQVLQVYARRQPLLLALDDLQWADEASISLLFHLGRRLSGQRILILGAYRPEEVSLGRNGARHPLEQVLHEFQRDFGDLFVNLDQAQGREFIDALLDSEPNRIDPAFRDTLYQHTRGHPLFTIEFLRGLQQRGDLVKDASGYWTEGASLNWDQLPPRVEAVIAERIARLPEVWRQSLSIASVEGEDFTAEVVSRIQGISELDLQQYFSGPLSRQHLLVRAQGIQRIGDQRLSRYRFQHFLFQKYLYQQLDPVERAGLHETVGCVLENVFAGQTNEVVVRLAWHFEEAGLVPKAVAYLQQAAERSDKLSAYSEAIAYYRHALVLLETLPDSPERAGQELGLQMSLAVPLVANRGYSDPLVGQTYDRARQLCYQLGSVPQLVPVLYGLGAYYSLQARYLTAKEIYQQIQVIAVEYADTNLQMVADWQMGYLNVATGQYLSGRAYLEMALAAYNPETLDPRLYYQEPDVSMLSWLARGLWSLGYPGLAQERSRQALSLAQERSQPFGLAYAYSLAANLYMFLREVDETLLTAQRAVDISTRYGLPVWLGFGKALHGWALSQQGSISAGMSEIQQGTELIRAIGAQQPLMGCLNCLAESKVQAGQVGEALQIVDEALSLELACGGEFNLPLLYILRGDLLLLNGTLEAEASYHQAISIAQRQHAKSWELRALLSLCRLWQRQGKVDLARQHLSEVYAWFSEGFHTPDLMRARALLGELSQRVD